MCPCVFLSDLGDWPECAQLLRTVRSHAAGHRRRHRGADQQWPERAGHRGVRAPRETPDRPESTVDGLKQAGQPAAGGHQALASVAHSELHAGAARSTCVHPNSGE